MNKKKNKKTGWMRKETCKKEQQSKEDTSKQNTTFHLFEKNQNKTVARNYYYLQAQREWQEVRDVCL